jgi:hypothetical protein
MMKSYTILLLLCAAIITKADEELTLEIESDEFMKTGDLEQAETKDASATEIIKQIRKVNADGTYTIGFEADDGSFKIETRDLQGNVKQGTYGYVDENGDVKRVSYSTENSTIFKSAQEDETKEEEEKETISLSPSTRYNRTFGSTTRRPSSLSYLTSTSGPTIKPSVVQNIPKRKILLPSERTTLRPQNTVNIDRTRQSFEGTTTLVYATSVPTPKPYSSRSTTSPSYLAKATERSDKVEIDQVERKVYISSARDPTTMKPILSKDRNDEKAENSKRGNALRRQLKQDDEGIEAQQQILYGSGDEGSSIYGSGYANVRPLFTTTSQPRIPLQVLAARQRATQLQSVLANSATTTTEKALVKTLKRQNLAKVKVEEATENLNENFLTQPSRVEPLPASESETDERRVFQRPLPPQLEGLYRPRNYLRQLQQQELQQQQQQQQPIQDPRLAYRIPPNVQGPDPTDLRQPTTPAAQRFAEQYQQPQNQQYQQLQGQQPQGFSNQPAESFASPFFPQRQGYDLDRPLTVRDFERLLQLLVFRQQQPQRPYQVNPFYPPSNPASYPPFIPGYNQPFSQIPRPPFYNPVTSGLYDPGFENPYYSPSSPRATQQQYPGAGVTQPPNEMFQQSLQNQQQQQVADPNYEMQRLLPRRRQYDPRLYAQQTQLPSPPINPSEQEINYNSLQSQLDGNFLPPSVREQLLYRMLMLAIRNDQSYAQSTTAAATASSDTHTVHTVLEPEQQEANIISTKAPVASKKPVRSVQILGEDDSESI